jgi:hypothetical protein
MRLVLTDHPTELDEATTAACARVCTAAPEWVTISPSLDALPNKCILNARRVEASGRGRCITGWKVLTWPRVLVQLVGHAVIAEAGRLTCVTPDLYGSSRILFVRDDRIFFDSTDDEDRMPTRLVPFDADPAVDRFIDAQERILAIKRKFPPSRGLIRVAGQDAVALRELEARLPGLIREIALKRLGENDRCVCDSGQPFAQCCRKAMIHGVRSQSS